MKPEEHSVSVMDAKVQYWEYHSQKTATIVMIHGFRGTHHGLEKIAESLSDYHLIIPDLPGFGESEAFQHHRHDIASYTTFLSEFIEKLDLKQSPVVLGHSFGSVICGHFAAQHPGQLSKLILINPIGSPALEGPRGLLTRLAVMYYWLGRKLPKGVDHAWLSTPAIVKIMSVTMAKSKDKAMQTYIHDQHLQHFSTFANADVVAEAFQASVSHDVSHVIEDIETPTLLIAGDLDDITPLNRQKTLAARAKNAQLEIITDVGHLIHYEKAGEAATAIRAFLQQ